MAKSRILVIALLVSLGLNFAVGGFMAARWIYHEHAERGHAGFKFNRFAALETLEQTEQDKIRRLLKNRKGEIRSLFRSYRSNKQEMARLLKQNPLDKQSLENLRDTLANDRRAIEHAFNTFLIETAHIVPSDRRPDFFDAGFKKHRRKPAQERREKKE